METGGPETREGAVCRSRDAAQPVVTLRGDPHVAASGKLSRSAVATASTAASSGSACSHSFCNVPAALPRRARPTFAGRASQRVRFAANDLHGAIGRGALDRRHARRRVFQECVDHFADAFRIDSPAS